MLVLGRVHPVKNLELALSSLAALRKDRPEVTLQIAGPVTDRDYLAKLQAQAQAKQMEMQYKAQADEMERQLQAQLEMIRQQAQQQTDAQRQTMEAQMNRMKLEQEAQLAALKEQYAERERERQMGFQRWKAELDASVRIETANISSKAKVNNVATNTATAEIGREVQP